MSNKMKVKKPKYTCAIHHKISKKCHRVRCKHLDADGVPVYSLRKDDDGPLKYSAVRKTPEKSFVKEVLNGVVCELCHRVVRADKTHGLNIKPKKVRICGNCQKRIQTHITPHKLRTKYNSMDKLRRHPKMAVYNMDCAKPKS